MARINDQAAILLLEDGTVFHGNAIGKIGTTSGEICFNTGMTGYQEIFTDPSYYAQIMVMTTAHIGNYGMKKSEIESDDIKIAGLVTKNFTYSDYSRPQAESTAQEYLKEQGLSGITNIDTRALVKHIRSKGAMNAIISSDILDIEILKEKLAVTPSMKGLELASKVTTKEPYYIGNPNAEYKVAVLDFGTKRNILRSFAMRDCHLKVFPATTSYEEMEEWNPDGYFLSNGPGDPSSMGYAVKTAKQILNDNRPLFGICLGHQLLALAMDIPTYKMHNGHRGINHPVKNLVSGRGEITSQNHGFAVSAEAIEINPNVEITHINLNDDTIEGIKLNHRRAFSVQYHPEAAPGPHDAQYLFDEYVNMLKLARVDKELTLA
ncbi:MAG: glutamine-hydrolyzing carbamoyl-phosphate synthase small subunit [Saprospiraceae bacterium]